MTVPLHHNSPHANKILYWSGSDSYSAWQENMQDPVKSQILKDEGWDKEDSIKYQYNSHGFRCAEFDNTPVYIALGCSHTEGTGVIETQTWPSVLANQLECSVLNLGVSGSSLDTCYRLLTYYIDKLNIMGVFLLEPPPNRFEIFELTDPVTYTPMIEWKIAKHRKIIYQYWATSEQNILYNVTKNRHAIQHICNTHDIRLISFECDILKDAKSLKKARDLMHYHGESLRYVANEFARAFYN